MLAARNTLDGCGVTAEIMNIVERANRMPPNELGEVFLCYTRILAVAARTWELQQRNAGVSPTKLRAIKAFEALLRFSNTTVQLSPYRFMRNITVGGYRPSQSFETILASLFASLRTYAEFYNYQTGTPRQQKILVSVNLLETICNFGLANRVLDAAMQAIV